MFESLTITPDFDPSVFQYRVKNLKDIGFGAKTLTFSVTPGSGESVSAYIDVDEEPAVSNKETIPSQKVGDKYIFSVDLNIPDYTVPGQHVSYRVAVIEIVLSKTGQTKRYLFDLVCTT